VITAYPSFPLKSSTLNRHVVNCKTLTGRKRWALLLAKFPNHTIVTGNRRYESADTKELTMFELEQYEPTQPVISEIEKHCISIGKSLAKIVEASRK
jgi:hypothetical protein